MSLNTKQKADLETQLNHLARVARKEGVTNEAKLLKKLRFSFAKMEEANLKVYDHVVEICITQPKPNRWLSFKRKNESFNYTKLVRWLKKLWLK